MESPELHSYGRRTAGGYRSAHDTAPCGSSRPCIPKVGLRYLRLDRGRDWEEIAAWETEHPDPNAKKLEELKINKEIEISDACNTAIIAGIDVETTHGIEHFSLEETDQINLTTAYNTVL